MYAKFSDRDEKETKGRQAAEHSYGSLTNLTRKKGIVASCLCLRICTGRTFIIIFNPFYWAHLGYLWKIKKKKEKIVEYANVD